MKSKFILLILVFVFVHSEFTLFAQCDLSSPSIQILSSSENSNGDCVIHFNLSFIADLNNGNKKTYIHLWTEANYPNPPYNYNSAPTTVLDNTVANIIIDNINANNTPPTTPVFVNTYKPYTNIDNKVLDASEGLTFQRTYVSGTLYRYHIKNITITLPGPCDQVGALKGDIWSTQSSNEKNPTVHCKVRGFDLVVDGMDLIPTFTCLYPVDNSHNMISFTNSTGSPDKYIFDYMIVVDNGDQLYNIANDSLVYSSTSGPYTITSGTSFSSGNITYHYPSGWKDNNVFVVLKNIKIVQAGTTDTTIVENVYAKLVANTCYNSFLPLVQFNFYLNKLNSQSAIISWNAIEGTDITKYELFKSNDLKNWTKINTKKAAGNNKYNSYSYTDNDLNVHNYYRLIIGKTDGTFETSKIISAYGSANQLQMDIFPNPASLDNANIQINTVQEEDPYKLVIYDLSGNEIITKSGKGSAIEAVQYPAAGMYLIRLLSADQSITKKVLVQ